MSTNPYSQSAGGADAAAKSPEEQLAADYEIAVGPNRDYYVPRFKDFDEGGSKAGWNWPAFVVPAPWYLYRKMYGWGVLLLFLPLIQLIAISIVVAAVKAQAVGLTVAVVVLLAPWILFSVYANALYWRRIRSLLRNLPSSFANEQDKRAIRLVRNGGTALGPMIGIMLAASVFGLGILAGIAIPAYQDYTIRSQVTEGLNLASDFKALVAEHWVVEGKWPDQEELGVDPPSGKYVETVTVQSGSIIIVYGRDAHPYLEQQGLALTPGVTPDGDVVWVCGNASPPAGVTMSEGTSGSDVPNKYLPKSCRE